MKIITAIGDTYINNKLREIENIEVIGKDIQYQDGILEILEETNNIDLIILSNNILGNYEFNILINKIENINKNFELIIFLKEKDLLIENFLNSKNIYKIYYLNKENYEIFFNNFNSNNIKKEVEKEINDFKKIILKNNKINSKKYKNKKRKLRLKKESFISKRYIKIREKNIKKNAEIIAITGNYGSGKSVVSTMLSNVISNKNKKVLLIDFNIFNSSINSIFGIKKYPKNFNKLNYKSLIIKYNKNLNIFCGIDLLFNEKYEIKNTILNNIFNELKLYFEYIILDLNSSINYKFIKTILIASDKIIFLLEPNLIEIKKSQNILEVYLKDFNLNIDKIKIVFNKTNKYEIAESILEEIFSNFKIIGNIKYQEKYNLFLNNNKLEVIDKKEYEKIYSNL